MTNEVSGFGLKVRVTASITFPAGIEITQFADDADPLDMAAMQLKDTGMGLNGDMVVWGKPNVIPMVLNIIPNSEDDRNLQVLAQANRTGKGKRPVADIITAVIMYPDGTAQNLSRGTITDAVIGNGVASAGRLKSKPYTFKFENMV